MSLEYPMLSAAHIHMGKTGANGDIIADLLNTPTSKDKDTAYGMIIRGNISDSSLKGAMQGKTLDDLAAAIEKGDTYVNVHTTAHKDGEIRGQLAVQQSHQALPILPIQLLDFQLLQSNPTFYFIFIFNNLTIRVNTVSEISYPGYVLPVYLIFI